MKLEDVRNVANSRGAHPGKHPRTQLIEIFRAKEGSFDCFATAYGGICDQFGCLWRDECFEAAQ